MPPKKRDSGEAGARFWEWGPPGEGGHFRCLKSPMMMVMTDEMCRARAMKPEVFEEGCGGRPTCPRWRHYRRMAMMARREPDDAKRSPYR